jgi:hypothetical protein
MALNPAAGVDLSGHMPPALTACFLLGRNAEGAWVLREVLGRRGGLF